MRESILATVSFPICVSYNRAVATHVKFADLQSPIGFLEFMSRDAFPEWLQKYASWWEMEGQQISDALDSASYPHLRQEPYSAKKP